MNKLVKASALVLLTPFTQAYNSTFAGCVSFAELWSGSCGGTNVTAVYTTADWETTGAGVTTSSCTTTDSTVTAREPDSGADVTSYQVFARNCITCEEINSEVFIRL